MQKWKKHLRVITALALGLLLTGVQAKAATWQQTLQSKFDIVDTFDEDQDWTPGGQWYSSAGCPTCPSNSNLPKKADGTKSIWQTWNSKGLAFQYTPGSGTFANGDLIKGATSGATGTVRRVWNLDGKSYIQLTYDNTAQGTSKFAPGEKITSGTKTGTNLQWPLFIGNHGPNYVWRGSGKSLVLDIGDNDNVSSTNPTMAGLGAQRLGTFFGDGVSPKSGYKKLHVFFMMKVSPTFFNKCQSPGTTCVSGGYDPTSVIKAFDIGSGFTAINTWGTATDRSKVGSTWAYRLPEYGMNYSLFNFIGGGLSYPNNLFFGEHVRVATGSSGNMSVANTVNNLPMRNGTTTDVNSYIASGNWFGVEMASDIGTLGKSDGSTDLWIYDKNGTQVGHFQALGQNRIMYFDHLYNKMVLGGNRLSGSGKTGGLDSRWWIDDVVIHGFQVGPTYFQLMKAQSDSVAPTATLTAPTGGSNLAGTATLNASASDNTGVAKVEFYANGTLLGSDTASPYVYSWNTASVADGSYSLTAKAYDAAGNAGSSAAVTVAVKNSVVDTTAPTVSVSAPSAGATVSGSVPVSISATDNIGVSKVELYVDGALYGVMGASPYSTTWNSVNYSNASHTLSAKAYDVAGNVRSSTAVTVNVNNAGQTAAPSLTSSSSWLNQAMASQAGTFTASFDMVPSANNIDAVTAFSGVTIKGYTDTATAVRFNTSGTIDARNGSAYAAKVAIPYAAGKVYHVRMVISVPTRKYDVYVTPAGGTETQLAAGYAFRTEQAAVSALNNLGLMASTGTHQVRNLAVTTAAVAPAPAPAPVALTSSSAWQNQAISSQTGSFTASFDTVPSANNIDAVTAFSGAAISGYTGMASAVRFNTSGTFDARNGSSYGAKVAIPYAAGKVYRVRMVINVPTRKYDVYVTPPGGTETQLAAGYAFRSEQATVSALKNLGVIASPGSHQVRNLSIQ